MISFFSNLFKSFTRKEFLVFLIISGVFLISFFLALAERVMQKTKIVPKSGGDYSEGIVGQPSFINSVLANSDTDRDLVGLVFSNLGQLAENYKIEEKGRVWRYRLKDGIKWSDGEKITSDDIIFTVETIQNPDIYSPIFQNWQGVEIKRISEREVEFRLPAAYVFFESVMMDLKPIPKHIFAKIPAANIKLSDYNFQPIGSGPYKVLNFKKQANGFIDSYIFERNDNYPGDKAYLKKITVVFYSSEDEAIKAFNDGEIDGLGLASASSLEKIVFPHQIINFKTLKYYAVFFNSFSHKALKDKNVRMALDLAVDKKELVEKVLGGYGSVISGPLMEKVEKTSNVDKANIILDQFGWARNEEGIRQKTINKESIKMEFVLIIPQIRNLIKVGELIKEKWNQIGVKVDLLVMPLADINNQIIKTRDYQMIIFGNVLGKNPDIYSFWHSSEKFYPGLNLALYENKNVDRIIESIRTNFNEQKRLADLADLQSLIISDYPAIFLYAPDYLYVSKKDIFRSEGNSSPVFLSERFNNIEKWYIETARVFQ